MEKNSEIQLYLIRELHNLITGLHLSIEFLRYFPPRKFTEMPITGKFSGGKGRLKTEDRIVSELGTPHMAPT